MSRVHRLGEVRQRPNESIAYTVDVSNVGSSPTVNSVTVFDLTAGEVDNDLVSGSASVAGDVITSPLVTGLTDGVSYHLIFNYTISGQTLEDYLVINCTDER